MSSFNLGAALQNYRENSEITVLDPGTHRLECVSASAGKAKAGPTITPVFKVVGGPNAGRRVMVGKLSFAEAALWKTIPQIKGFGLDEEFLQMADGQPDPIKAVADQLVGKVVDATLSVDPWMGEDRNKLVSVHVASDHVAAPASPAAAAAAAAPADVPGPSPAF